MKKKLYTRVHSHDRLLGVVRLHASDIVLLSLAQHVHEAGQLFSELSALGDASGCVLLLISDKGREHLVLRRGNGLQ